jgi:hypothetical protein
MQKIASIVLTILAATAGGCNEDRPESEPIVIIEVPGRGPTIQILAPIFSSTVINIQNIFPAFRSLTIDDPSNRSTYFKNQYVKYESGGTDDSFEMTIVKASGEVVKSLVEFNVSQIDNSCADRDPFEYARISRNEVLVVNLLNNPEFCGYDTYIGAGELGVAGPQQGVDNNCRNEGGLSIEVCACDGYGEHIILTYVPPEGLIGRLRCKYYAHAEGDSNVGFPERFYDPAYSNYFSEHEMLIEVVN